MGIILKGIAGGFLVSIFISVYVEGFFNHLLPLWILYGIFAPFFSALIIFLSIISNKDEQNMVQWYEEDKKKK